MTTRRLIGQIFFSHLVVGLLALAAYTVYAASTVDAFYRAHANEDLKARARLMEDIARKAIEAGPGEECRALCTSLAERANARVTLILPSGEVIADSAEDPARMDNHSDRPEVVEAHSGKDGSSTRFSITRKRQMMYVAVPLWRGDQVMGVLRASLPLARVEEALWSDYANLLFAAGLIALATIIASLLLSRHIARPLEEMMQGVQSFRKGDFSHAIPPASSEELGALGDAMNQMAQELNGRITEISSQRNQQEAILSSMVEGVLVIDTEERILRMNKSAARMLGLDAPPGPATLLEGAVTNPGVRDFMREALAEPQPIETEFVLQGDGESTIQAHGTTLCDGQGNRLGAMAVLNDVTRLRRLEQVRQDFVANVSHELRTPITAIKGFIETLLDGAAENPQDARRFLEIALRQADRLMAILHDLLVLSRTEAGASAGGIPRERVLLREIVEAATALCIPKAEQKGVHLDWDCPEHIYAEVSAPLIEQAVANLIDNAIKYSESGTWVRVKVFHADPEVVIRVSDEGMGIESAHLPRLFERFYRVDKARSRQLGGTGLGLAIVKHIAQVHGGQVLVESVPGQGSTFSICLPR